jgi:hypothetical protein
MAHSSLIMETEADTRANRGIDPAPRVDLLA